MLRPLLRLGMHWTEEAYPGKLWFYISAFLHLIKSFIVLFLSPDTCSQRMLVHASCVFHTQHIQISISNSNPIVAGRNWDARQLSYIIPLLSQIFIAVFCCQKFVKALACKLIIIMMFSYLPIDICALFFHLGSW